MSFAGIDVEIEPHAVAVVDEQGAVLSKQKFL
jgi:hypothetical protein